MHFPSTAVAKQAGEKRKVGAPEEKAAKRQRTEEAEKEALRLYFKREEQKERGRGVPAWPCRWSVLDPTLRSVLYRYSQRC